MKKSLFVLFFILITFQLFAQLPNISYSPMSNVFNVNEPISSLVPINEGGNVINDVVVTTFAGSGIIGSDNGNGIAASFRLPTYVALDNNDNIIVVDRSNHLIRKITPSGDVTTIAGTGTSGNLDGPALLAKFRFPDGAVVDSQGNTFITDQSNHTIRKIGIDGEVTTFAGAGTIGSDDGQGILAKFYFPAGITIDSNDNLYIADYGNNKIRKITPLGLVTTFAGSGIAGNTNGQALVATFNELTGVAIDSQNNLYVADYGNHIIRKIDFLGEVTTFAGSGVSGSLDDIGILASFYNPASITIDASDNLFITDYNNNKIRKITPLAVVSTYAGSGSYGNDEGSSLTASFKHPTCLVAKDNLVYVCDYENHKIRKITYYGYSIVPQLPSGLVLDPTTGVISGTPTITSPTTNYTITANNTSGSSSFTITITINELGNEDFNYNSITIHPNPLKDKITFDSIEKINTIVVYNLLGQEVFYQKNNQDTIDLNFLEKGVYFVKITTFNSEKIAKVIKD